ncbi:MAG: hypothetical protein R3B06_01780 [Kofleriaceae bacterium]
MKRRRGGPTAPAVSWRDGVHVVGTSIWCDARRRRGVCFVSAADRLGRGSHGQLIATAPTLALLGASKHAHLSVPVHRPFTLGTVRLTLLPSGHGPGGAALHVDTGSHRVLYAGAVDPRRAELIACDTLVVAAPYGAPHHQFPADAEAQGVAFCQAAAAAGQVALVLVTSTVRGLAVAERLAAAGLSVAGHRSVVDGAARLAEAALPAPLVRRSVARADVLVWPLAEHARAGAALGARPTRRLLASGLATEPAALAGLELDLAVAWSGAADRAALVRFVAGSGATDVAVTGPWAAAIAAAVGPRARTLGAPEQMALFAS